ncbi:MAG TPA: hypothetical protein PLI59_08220 [Candidatus Obscuribacter sp.]|nr:hypothetical protein [Candidatus Obscuribacter sp.]
MQNQTETKDGTQSSLAELEALMTRVLRAHRPLKELATRLTAAQARESLLWQTFKRGVLPDKCERKLIEDCVDSMLADYEQFLPAQIAHTLVKRDVYAAETDLRLQVEVLQATLEAATTAGLQGELLAAAGHLVQLGQAYQSLLNSNEPPLPPPSLEAVDSLAKADQDALQARIQELREAIVDQLCLYLEATNLHARLEPLAWKKYRGSGIHQVATPVRPIEEEVQRYLGELETRVKWRRALHGEIYPLFQERLRLKSAMAAAHAKTNEILQDPYFKDAAMAVNGAYGAVQGLKAILRHLMPNKRREEQVLESSSYEETDADHPEKLDSFSRVTPTKTEKDQIEFLRKQSRALAYARAHLNEAVFAQSKHRSREVKATVADITTAANFAELQAWHETFLNEEKTAALQNHQNTTRSLLLKSTVEHWEDKTRDEMVTLYKELCAMLPRKIDKDPKPCDELRDLINVAAYLTKQLDGSEAVYPVY